MRNSPHFTGKSRDWARSGPQAPLAINSKRLERCDQRADKSIAGAPDGTRSGYHPLERLFASKPATSPSRLSHRLRRSFFLDCLYPMDGACEQRGDDCALAADRRNMARQLADYTALYFGRYVLPRLSLRRRDNRQGRDWRRIFTRMGGSDACRTLWLSRALICSLDRRSAHSDPLALASRTKLSVRQRWRPVISSLCGPAIRRRIIVARGELRSQRPTNLRPLRTMLCTHWI